MMLYFFMLPTSLVRMEDGFCKASGLEQREAQNAVSYTHLLLISLILELRISSIRLVFQLGDLLIGLVDAFFLSLIHI